MGISISKRMIKMFISVSLSVLAGIGLVMGNDIVTGTAVGGLVAYLTSEKLNDNP